VQRQQQEQAHCKAEAEHAAAVKEAAAQAGTAIREVLRFEAQQEVVQVQQAHAQEVADLKAARDTKVCYWVKGSAAKRETCGNEKASPHHILTRLAWHGGLVTAT